MRQYMTADPSAPPTARILFIGDVVGEAGMAHLEAVLPGLRDAHEPDFVVVNGENAALAGPNPIHGAGMTPRDAERLFALGVDVVTGGNHSWDGPHVDAVHAYPRVLRPLNVGPAAPGRGAVVVEGRRSRLGVVNLASRTALPRVDQPYDVLRRQLATWAADGAPDLVLVDFHGESVSEKQIFAWAVDGLVTAVLGTHTHVPTLDVRVLPGGTAYVSDVGMTGPSGGMQGYEPGVFVEAMRTRMPGRGRGGWASGPVELGAVLVTTSSGHATGIRRLRADEGGGPR